MTSAVDFEYVLHWGEQPLRACCYIGTFVVGTLVIILTKPLDICLDFTSENKF